MRLHSMVSLITNSSSEAFTFRRSLDVRQAIIDAYKAYLEQEASPTYLADSLLERGIERHRDWATWDMDPPEDEPELDDDLMELDVGSYGESLPSEFREWMRDNYTKFGFEYFGRVE